MTDDDRPRITILRSPTMTDAQTETLRAALERRVAVPVGANPVPRCCGAVVDDTGPIWTICHRPVGHAGPCSAEWPRP